MARYLVQPKDLLFATDYGFLSFAKNVGKIIGKYISNSLNSKHSQRHLDHAKQSATDAFKTSSKRVIQKTAEASGDFIGNKIADLIKLQEFQKRHHKII